MKRRVLSGLGFWMVLAYFGLALVVVWLYVVNSRTIRDEAIRAAETQATQTAAVQRCLSSRAPLMRVSDHVRGVNEFAAVLVENSAHVLDRTPRSDPQYEVRKANLIRLIRAREKIKAVESFPVPTAAQCRERRDNN